MKQQIPPADATAEQLEAFNIVVKALTPLNHDDRVRALRVLRAYFLPIDGDQ